MGFGIKKAVKKIKGAAKKIGRSRGFKRARWFHDPGSALAQVYYKSRKDAKKAARKQKRQFHQAEQKAKTVREEEERQAKLHRRSIIARGSGSSLTLLGGYLGSRRKLG